MGPLIFQFSYWQEISRLYASREHYVSLAALVYFRPLALRWSSLYFGRHWFRLVFLARNADRRSRRQD